MVNDLLRIVQETTEKASKAAPAGAPPKKQKKPVGYEVVAPSGRVYDWNKPDPPTKEDFEELQEIENRHLAIDRSGSALKRVFSKNEGVKDPLAGPKGYSTIKKMERESAYQAKQTREQNPFTNEGLANIPLPPRNQVEANEFIRDKTTGQVLRGAEALESTVGAAVGMGTGGASLGAIAFSGIVNAAFRPGGSDAVIGLLPGIGRFGKQIVSAVRSGDLTKTVQYIDQAGLAAQDAAELKAGLRALAWRNETEESVLQKLGIADAPTTKQSAKQNAKIPWGKIDPGTKPPPNPVTDAIQNAKNPKKAPTATVSPAVKANPVTPKSSLREVPESADVTAARNASQNVKREVLGLDELPDVERKTFVESLDNAAKSGEKNKTAYKAQALLEEKNPRAWTDEESAGAIIAQRELENEADTLAKRIEADPNDIEAATRLNAVQAEYDTISQALNKVGTQAARTLAIRRLGLQPNYKPVVIKARIKALTGKDVDAKTSAYIDRLTKELDEANANISRLENEANAAGALDTFEANKRNAPRFSKEELDKELDEILAEFNESRKAAMGAAHDVVGATTGAVADYSKLIGKVALNYTKRGINTLDEVVVKTIQYAKEKFGIEASEADIVKAMTEVNQVTKKQVSDEIAALRKNQANIKRDAKSYYETQKKIETLEQKLKYEYSDLPKKPKRDQGKLIEDQKARATVLRKELETQIEARRPKTKLEKISNIAGAPRSLASSVDISAPGRQGWLLALAHPQHAVKAFGHQVRALLSEDYAAKVANNLKARQNYANYEHDGLYLAELSAAPNKAEEAFKSRLFAGWMKYNPVRASERAYTTYLNVVRADAYDTMVKALPGATDAERKAIANWVNVASGRGGIEARSATGKAMEAAAGILFSPRYQASRMQVLAGQPLYGGSLRTRALIAGEYGKVFGAVGTMLGIAKAAGAEVSTDSTSSDFLKIKIGDSRIDLMAGLQQYIVLGSRTLSQQKTTIDGDTRQAPPGMGEKFVRSKANPTAGLLYDATLGGRKNYLGEQLSWKDTLNMLPMSPKELVEGLVEDGWGREDAIGLLNFLGIGVQTYKTNPKRDRPN